MAEPDSHKEEKRDIQAQSAPREQEPAQDNAEMSAPNVSFRALGSWIAGGVGAIAGWFGGEQYVSLKMRDFNGAVSKAVRDDIMNGKGGIGAGLDSAGGVIDYTGLGGGLGGLGRGAGSHDIRAFHEYSLAESGKFPFARFVQQFGAWPVTIGAALGTAIVAVIGYRLFAPKEKLMPVPEVAEGLGQAAGISHAAPEESKLKDWQASIASKKADPQPALGA